MRSVNRDAKGKPLNPKTHVFGNAIGERVGSIKLWLAWIDRAVGPRVDFNLPLVLAGMADEGHDDDGAIWHSRDLSRDTYTSSARRTLAPD